MKKIKNAIIAFVGFIQNTIMVITNFVLHHGEKSYQVFGEYHDGFTGFLIFRNGQAEVKNAGILFRGDFVILVSKWHSDEDGTIMYHERLTINVNEIAKILN